MSYDHATREAEQEPRRPRDWTAKWNGLQPLMSANGDVAERVKRFCESKQIGVDDLARIGARIAIRRGGGIWLAFAGRNGQGAVTAIKYRPLDGSSHDTEAETPSVWLRPIVVGRPDALDWLFAEGETDGARLLGLAGDGAAILVLPAGARAFKPEWAAIIPRGATVHLALDADDDGDEGARKIAAMLGGRTVRVRPPEGVKDWCDWDGDRQAFVQLVAAARAARGAELAGRTHAQVLDLRFEGERNLIEGLAEPGTVGVIAGIPETHKSHLAQAIASGIALGKGEVLGRAVEVQGPVGYFWQDDSERNEAERVQTYSAARNLPRDLPVRWYLNEGVELPRDIDKLRDAIELHGFVLVVLDSFYNFAPGISLKDEDAAAIIADLKLRACDATGCGVLIVDHSPWPSESNRGQRRAYGSVLKSAAWRYGIYLERDGSKLHVSARGNNVRGLKRSPVIWDEEAHELRLVDIKVDTAADDEALDWVVAYVGREHAKDGRGVPRGEVETAYHEAQDGHGRNRARRVIDAQLELVETLAVVPLDEGYSGEAIPRLARGTGKVTTGVYLYPFAHAPSPLAATPNDEGGEEARRANESEPLAASPATLKGGERSGGEEDRGGEEDVSS